MSSFIGTEMMAMPPSTSQAALLKSIEPFKVYSRKLYQNDQQNKSKESREKDARRKMKIISATKLLL